MSSESQLMTFELKKCLRRLMGVLTHLPHPAHLIWSGLVSHLCLPFTVLHPSFLNVFNRFPSLFSHQTADADWEMRCPTNSADRWETCVWNHMFLPSQREEGFHFYCDITYVHKDGKEFHRSFQHLVLNAKCASKQNDFKQQRLISDSAFFTEMFVTGISGHSGRGVTVLHF